MLEGDLVEAGEDPAPEAAAAEGRRHVHALHLRDLGVEVADPTEAGGLGVHPGQQQHPFRRRQVRRRSLRDLLVEVDPGVLAVEDQRSVGLYRAAGYREVPAYNENPKADLWFERSLEDG